MLNKSTSDIVTDLQKACPTSAPSRATVYRWNENIFFRGNILQLKTPRVKQRKLGGGGGGEQIAARVCRYITQEEIIPEDDLETIQETAKTLDIAFNVFQSVSKISRQ